MQTATRRSLDALTGARFLAALWVVVYHYTTQFRFQTGKEQLEHRKIMVRSRPSTL
ncbi:MAG TPA: hypothetical protein VGP82_13400 [Ktedonobacterales bacterium]|nr:hypothetical protein [Ktedonobacterales bacterium]